MKEKENYIVVEHSFSEKFRMSLWIADPGFYFSVEKLLDVNTRMVSRTEVFDHLLALAEKMPTRGCR